MIKEINTYENVSVESEFITVAKKLSEEGILNVVVNLDSEIPSVSITIIKGSDALRKIKKGA